MSGVVHGILQRFADQGCLVDAIGTKECKVSLADAPASRAVVDLDADGSPLGRTRVKCDYLFFEDPNLAAAIEIKDGEPNVKHATEQLQKGAKAVDDLTPRDREIVFRPVLVSKSLRRKKQMDLRQAVVRFRRRPEKIRRIACGGSLTEAFGSA